MEMIGLGATIAVQVFLVLAVLIHFWEKYHGQGD